MRRLEADASIAVSVAVRLREVERNRRDCAPELVGQVTIRPSDLRDERARVRDRLENELESAALRTVRHDVMSVSAVRVRCFFPRSHSFEDRSDMPTPRVSRPIRNQAEILFELPEDALAPEHPARVLWSVFSRMDLSKFLSDARAFEGGPGRSTTDPRMLLTLSDVRDLARGRQRT